MKLTERQATVFTDWIRRKVEHLSCRVCQSSQTRLGDLIRNEDDNVLEEPAAHCDMVQLICYNCGHVLLFDTRIVEGWQAASPHDPTRSAIM